MKNKLSDLNNHLFAELERLGDEDLKGEELAAEVERAKSISNISSQIVQNANVQLKAPRLQAEYGYKNVNLGGLLEHKDDLQ